VGKARFALDNVTTLAPLVQKLHGYQVPEFAGSKIGEVECGSASSSTSATSTQKHACYLNWVVWEAWATLQVAITSENTWARNNQISLQAHTRKALSSAKAMIERILF
jgi:hypothetical protein